jgi:hypothetical protein
MIRNVSKARSRSVGLLVFAATLVFGLLVAIPTASAAGFSGGFGPTIYGNLADVNGSGPD